MYSKYKCLLPDFLYDSNKVSRNLILFDIFDNFHGSEFCLSLYDATELRIAWLTSIHRVPANQFD